MIAGFDTIGIMKAGGWRPQAVLARYVENASAKHMHSRRWQRLRPLHQDAALAETRRLQSA